MDNNIGYTLTIPLLFGIFCGYFHHFNHLYVSNTKLIIRQSEQIQFILGRMIELENKIRILKSDASNEQVEEELEVENEEVEDLNEDKEDLSDFFGEEILEKDTKEEVFEIIEPTLSPNSHANKKSGWLSFLF